MKFEKLSHEERVEYLLLPILKVLQSAGGQLTRTEIQEKICAEDDDISEFFAKQGANYSLDTNEIRNKEDLYAYYETIEKV